MAINIQDGFNVQTNKPIDARFVFADETARDALSELLRFEGLFAFVVSEQMNFQLVGGIANGNWVPFAGGGSGSGVVVVETYVDMYLIPDEDREEGMIVYVKDVKENWQFQGGIEDEDLVQIDQGLLDLSTQALEDGDTVLLEDVREQILFVMGDNMEAEFLLPNPTKPNQKLYIQGVSSEFPAKLGSTSTNVNMPEEELKFWQNRLELFIGSPDMTKWTKVGGW